MLIAKAFLLGLMLSLFIGPLFFMLIQASVKEGYKGGFKILLGLYLSDILYVISTYFFFDFLIKLSIPVSSIKLVGGLFFIVIGVFYFFKKKSKSDQVKPIKSNHVLKSFIINTLNPSVFFFWFAVISWGAQEFTSYDLKLYLALGLFFALLFDLLKIYFSILLYKLVNTKSRFGFNKIIGLSIIIIGATLVYGNI